jgi:GNAT superfamily N-acetyltransferase
MIDFRDITDQELNFLETARAKDVPNLFVETRTKNPVINELRFNHGFVYVEPRLFDLKTGYSNLELHFTEEDKLVYLGYIGVVKEQRRKGHGTRIMRILTELCDKYSYNMELEISSRFGTKRSALGNFYKRFGFKKIKGENKYIREIQA